MLSSTVSYAQSERFDWDSYPSREFYEPLIKAIAQVESEGNPKAISKDGSSVGLMQITKVLVKDVNQRLKEKGSKKRFTYNDRLNADKSVEMFIIYQEHYNKEHNIEKAIRMWNGGIGYRKNLSKTNHYYKKVMKRYRTIKKK